MRKQINDGALRQYAKFAARKVDAFRKRVLNESKARGGITNLRALVFEDRTVWLILYKDGTCDHFSGAVPDVVLGAINNKLNNA